MQVAVVVYSPASRTYIVEIPDGTKSRRDITAEVTKSDASKWKHSEEWDEDPDWDDVRDPVEILSLDKDGNVQNLLWSRRCSRLK